MTADEINGITPFDEQHADDQAAQERTDRLAEMAPGVVTGLCECGCGGRTTISEYTSARCGYVKGRPRRFIRGHAGRKENWVVDAAGCWIWQGRVHNGYGRASLSVDGKRRFGKRVREQAGLSAKHSFNRTVLDEVVREQIDYSLKEVFTADVEAGKAKLRETLQAKAAELLAAESMREAGIR